MKKITSKLPLVARLFLGALFFVFGLNKFLNFIPHAPMEGATLTYMTGLMAGGYLFPLLALTEIVAGALLLANRFVPLAIAILAPVIVNITGFHMVLAPEGAPMVVALLAAEIYLAWAYRKAFAPMLQMRVAPAAPEAVAERTRLAEAA